MIIVNLLMYNQIHNVPPSFFFNQMFSNLYKTSVPASLRMPP